MFTNICRTIYHHCPNQAAKAYAEAVLDGRVPITEQAYKVQALYLLSNLQYWRHPEAKRIRAFLKGYAS